MTDSDFDVDGLAKYLHLSPQQVEKLASRDKLPCRRVAGKWRFHHADIHHWMEERMGVLEDDELLRVEDAMASAESSVAEDAFLREMLCPETIAIPLAAKTKNAAIDQMTQLATTTGMLWDADRMADAVRSREQMQSTAMDSGVALLHPRRPLPSILGEPILAVGITSQGIPFGGSRRLTDVFFLICSTDDRGHLKTLARLSRLLTNDDFLDRLRASDNAKQAYDIICEAESELPSK